MTTTAFRQQTYLPQSEATTRDLTDFVADHRGESSYTLVAKDGASVAIPAALSAVLQQILEAMQAGRAVTVSTHARMVTSQEAADLLGVSRPTVIKLIDTGALPCDRTGHRRKIAVEDVMRYRQRRKEEQFAALQAIAVDPFEDDDTEAALALLKEQRKARAQQRQA